MIDILHTPDGDIDLSSGDLVWCDTERATDQHKRDILLASPGDFKESPTVGVGAAEYLNDEAPGLFLREVRKQMQADGIRIKRVAFAADGELEIQGSYENS